MSKSVTIGEATFASMKSAKKAVQQFLKNQTPGMPFAPADLEFVTDLLRRHPNPAYRVAPFHAMTEFTPPNTCHLWITYQDAAARTRRHKISWNKCLGLKKDTPDSLL